MKIDIQCKGMSLTDAIRDHVEDKLGKLEKLLPGEVDVLTMLAHEAGSRGGLYKAEVTLRAWGTDIVAKDTNEDLYKAIGVTADATFAQARKAKEKQKTARKGGDSVRTLEPPKEPMTLEEEEAEVLEEMGVQV